MMASCIYQPAREWNPSIEYGFRCQRSRSQWDGCGADYTLVELGSNGFAFEVARMGSDRFDVV